MGIANTLPQRPPDPHNTPAVEELRAIRHELEALRESFDAFASAFLAARFPYGRATDRLARRPRG